jgi:hypothetical protein
MRVRKLVAYVFATLACLAVVPSAAWAQSAITGVVKDTSGAILPGVTVEAASDALIEKSRSVVTDGEGVYRIVDLRPGAYVVTFSLEGFQTLKRDGLQLPSEFTMTINADMKVGSLSESITVSGAAPVVDVSSAVHTQVLNREAIDAIPTGKTIQGMGQLVVGVSLNLPDTGGARAMQQTYMSTHGMPAASNTVLIDGMIVNGLQSDGAIQSYFNDAMNQEVSYQTSGINAETSAGGVRLNMIPREGGNTFSGAFSSAYRPSAWQGNNVGPRLQALGVQEDAGNGIDRIIDASGSEGGPVLKDKLWFFGAARYFSVNNFIANTTMDDGSQGVDDQYVRSGLIRLTWQITPKVKLSAYQDEIDKYRGHDMQANYDPETAGVQWFSPAYHTQQAKLSATLTSRLMLEAGYSSNLEYYTNSYQNGIEQPRGTLDWYNNTAMQEANLGGVKRAALNQTTESPARYNWQGAVTYVTGSHNVKVGGQYQQGTYYHTRDANGDLYQVYRSSAEDGAYSTPDSVVVRNTPLARYGEKVNHDIGIFAQDTWTMNRLSLNAGIRYEWLQASVMAADTPAGRWAPARHFDGIENLPNWHNPAPRLSAVYDLFGNSKTAIKYSLNRYNQTRTTGIAANYNPLLQTTAVLPWTDLNHDDIAQGERGCVYKTEGCEIDSSKLSPTFGAAAQNSYNNFPRVWDLESGLELQHELLPRLSVTASWFHGTFHNLTSTINTALATTGDPAQNPNYIPYSIYNPVTGEPITIYGRTPTASSAITNVDSLDKDRKQSYNAYNLEFRARLGVGAQVFGGFAFERQLNANCNVVDNPNNLRFCDDADNDIPYAVQFKVAGSYPLKYGLLLSGSFQSNAGAAGTYGFSTSNISSTQYMAITGTSRYPSNCPAPCPAGSVILPAGFLGASTSPGSINVPLTPADGYYIERINQLDFKVSRNFKVNRINIAPTFEVFNINNSDALISTVTNNQLSPSYRYANSVMQPRLLGVGVQVKW